ncbi:bifunctional phosphopantothenoylcysteine decarboxylase/phosphopantothenate--cysteine ligase CoaBC [Geosporobacter ferrireducens]|uniref:Coenzyme A biosynthesis bifunctional protein CoaBC n=1 Tax=Geosporobacter ferrireducens TaxID=1424294 RepID=A0A1D8GBY4_9FIRM|nr:bifunctional phosphopantothenoylcysteine decarboxylase/phosphopantothenate--cysteine ligase CoaBC [Geosporobacter ferrireducens]AOT68419.1 phosphopantothenoylcysteine decarboxylase [Geosporobacter ferrireducens]MTI53874.1 bifunctional phosphopantothenoylcysteine decarboxylase/phosphopantothenate--cysteine ligase CoaBC [Geosporobacter ferrireducens]
MYSDKNVVIGVTGGIAAYKAADIVSRLRKLCINVNVIMTKSAQEFVQPLTFQAISQNYVVTDMFEEPKTWDVEHISIAQKADVFLIAPATANVIGKIAGGIADDMLTTTVMATKAPVLIAPAMNTNMYENPIVQKNIEALKCMGYHFVEPTSGRLACGDFGKGKMAEPEVIVSELLKLLSPNKDLQGKNVLVTAGPTREAIDPVRFITNHSSGKMGYAIAERAAARGAEVMLVSGPTNLPTPIGVKRLDVNTTNEMYNMVIEHSDKADIIIKSAAVADYRPETVAENKIKKGDVDIAISLTRNPDILKKLGEIKKDGQVLVGFAAETQDIIENAKSKVERKNLDFIVANDLTKDGAGFKGDTNIVTIIDSTGDVQHYEKMDKKDLADIILDKAKSIYIKE